MKETTIEGDEERNGFLFKKLGVASFKYEKLMFQLAERFSPDYQGGFWTFVELEKGGFYAYPYGDKEFRVSVDTNGYEGTMSAKAFGIGVSIFAQNWMMSESDAAKSLKNYRELLRRAILHEESREIARMID
jgi:hypothetical protein